MSWWNSIKPIVQKGTQSRRSRLERSRDAEPTTIKISELRSDGFINQSKEVPLNEKNYTIASRRQKAKYHYDMKYYYLIRGQPGDGNKAHFHREIEEQMRITMENDGKTFDMKGNDITLEENERMALRRIQYLEGQIRRNALGRQGG